MIVDSLLQFAPLVAATEASGLRRAIEFDWPDGPAQWTLYVGGFVVVIVLAVLVYLRDTADLSGWWKAWLIVLRLGVFAALVAIAINPQERTQSLSYRPSRVAVLVDRSQSMRYPSNVPPDGTLSPASSDLPSRADAALALFKDSPLIKTLQADHDVSIYSFDSALHGAHRVFRSNHPLAAARDLDRDRGIETSGDGGAKSAATASLDWAEITRPDGLETRLGESLLNLTRQVAGRTLAGIVVVTDGGSNAGVEPTSAAAAARAAKARLLTVGVGSTAQPVNLRIANLQAPTDVHVGDKFEISAFVQGQGLAGRMIQVDLLMRPEGETSEPTVVATRELPLAEDAVPVEVKFEQHPSDAATLEFFLRARTAVKVHELTDDDNERRKTINIVDRKLRVLVISGGPMRDYQFVRSMLHRHSAIELDVWLQTVDPGTAVSQDCHALLIQFPETREELFSYDVLVAFDPDWKRVPAESLKMLNDWVFAQAGGLVLIPGAVHTGELVKRAQADDAWKPVAELYPVTLEVTSLLSDLLSADQDSAAQPWPVVFTREGLEAGFLQLTDDAAGSAATWQGFSGVFHCYPTRAPKASAIVYAHHSDPRAQTEFGQPVLLASQFFGSGRAFYIGTSELWRLRSMDEDYYDRFWTKLVREAGQARLQRGTRRGFLLLERTEYSLGQTVRVRVQLLDPQFNELVAESAAMEVFDPSGRLLVPPRPLFADKNRAGQFVGDFHASLPGTYRIEIPIPESTEQLTGKVDVVLPNLESDNSRLNVQLLRQLAEETGGAYFDIEEAAQEIPRRLPNQGEEFLIHESLATLWDREWLMYLLVAFLSAEWLTRKLLKLA